VTPDGDQCRRRDGGAVIKNTSQLKPADRAAIRRIRQVAATGGRAAKPPAKKRKKQAVDIPGTRKKNLREIVPSMYCDFYHIALPRCSALIPQSIVPASLGGIDAPAFFFWRSLSGKAFSLLRNADAAERVALIFGNGDYQNAPRLPNPRQ